MKDLECDGCEVSLWETRSALGVVNSRSFHARGDFSAAIIPAIDFTGPLVAKNREAFNPFYAVLVLAGVAFAITACAYGVMTFVSLRAAEMGENPAALPSSLARFMNDYGEALLGGELLLLAVATVGAISTDRYWQRRAAERRQDA
jgi:hypothetical protein